MVVGREGIVAVVGSANVRPSTLLGGALRVTRSTAACPVAVEAAKASVTALDADVG